MAIRFMDNFSMYGTGSTGASNMLNGVWAAVSFHKPQPDPDPNLTGYCLNLQGDADNIDARVVINPSGDVFGIACRVWMAGLPSTSSRGFEMVWKNEDNQYHCYLKVITTGELEVRASDGTLLGSSNGPVLVSNAWQHVEARARIHATNGSMEVRVDGATVIDLDNINTIHSGGKDCAQIAFRNFSTNGGAVNTYIKDLIVWDDAGAFNNDFIGLCQVVTLTPDGDEELNWAPNTGTTGFDKINESPPDNDTTYIAADDTPPAASTFTLSDLPPDVVTVRGIQTAIRAKKTDGGDGNLQVTLVSGSDTVSGLDRPITVAYTYWYDIFETDPATATYWTPLAVDAARIRIDRTL